MIIFINVLDFMMVMPLGPDYAAAIGTSLDKIGIIAGSYTFAAAIMGFLCSFFIDRFDRRNAILFCLLGLAASTAITALAWDLHSMTTARLVAGCFGGPLTALSNSLVADVIPHDRRGRAFGKVMGAFSIASIVGVPFGLELSHYFGWRAPFLVLAAIALLAWLVAFKFLPHNVNTIAKHHLLVSLSRTWSVINRKISISALSIILFSMGSMFLIVPNTASYFIQNLNYPRESLGLLYLVGGIISFFTMRLAGRFVDSKGSTFVASIAFVILATAIYLGFINYHPFISPIVIFTAIMCASTARNVAMQATNAKVPHENERGSFMSLNSMLNHIGASSGAYLSSAILTESNGRLVNMEIVASLAIIISFFVPLMFYFTEKHLKKDARYIILPDA